MNKALVSDISLQEVPPDELGALAAMHLEIWQQAYLPVFSERELRALELEEFRKDWQERSADGGREVSWIVLNGRKVGFLSFVPEGTENRKTAEVSHFYLLPSFWGSGVASAAMKALLLLLLSQGVEEVRLWVLEGNARAQQFYTSCNFRHDGQQRTRYRHSLRLEEVLMFYRL